MEKLGVSFIYRFVDEKGEILYVGRTRSLKRRMSDHFTFSGHLPRECIESVKRIDFLEVATRDAAAKERFYISKYKTRYNKKDVTDIFEESEERFTDAWLTYRDGNLRYLPHEEKELDKLKRIHAEKKRQSKKYQKQLLEERNYFEGNESYYRYEKMKLEEQLEKEREKNKNLIESFSNIKVENEVDFEIETTKHLIKTQTLKNGQSKINIYYKTEMGRRKKGSVGPEPVVFVQSYSSYKQEESDPTEDIGGRKIVVRLEKEEIKRARSLLKERGTSITEMMKEKIAEWCENPIKINPLSVTPNRKLKQAQLFSFHITKEEKERLENTSRDLRCKKFRVLKFLFKEILEEAEKA